jgi:hypothetical protein
VLAKNHRAVLTLQRLCPVGFRTITIPIDDSRCIATYPKLSVNSSHQRFDRVSRNNPTPGLNRTVSLLDADPLLPFTGLSEFDIYLQSLRANVSAQHRSGLLASAQPLLIQPGLQLVDGLVER